MGLLPIVCVSLSPSPVPHGLVSYQGHIILAIATQLIRRDYPYRSVLWESLSPLPSSRSRCMRDLIRYTASTIGLVSVSSRRFRALVCYRVAMMPHFGVSVKPLRVPMDSSLTLAITCRFTGLATVRPCGLGALAYGHHPIKVMWCVPCTALRTILVNRVAIVSHCAAYVKYLLANLTVDLVTVAVSLCGLCHVCSTMSTSIYIPAKD
jgi:hypothetical protein